MLGHSNSAEEGGELGQQPAAPKKIDKLIAVSNATLGPVVTEAKAAARLNFSYTHLAAVEHFTTELIAHEKAFEGKGYGEHLDQATWLASACFLLTYAAIESAVDEATDDLKMPAEVVAAIASKKLFDRCDEVLKFKSAGKLLRGAPPAQPVALLRLIRNALAHPKSEWSDQPKEYAELSKRIVAAKIPLSPFCPDPDDAFPRGCMSAGACDWARKTAREFINHFRKKLGLVEQGSTGEA